MQEIKDSVTLNYEQQRNLVELIDNYIVLVKISRKGYCCNPEARYDKDMNMVCSGECENCERKYYSKYRKCLLENVGLSYLIDEEENDNAN